VPTIRDQAVCIRHWDFSETSQTVGLLTREHGVIRGLAKGAKREKGAFSGGIDLLTVGEVVAIVKPGRDLATLTQWHLQRAFPLLRRDLEANRTAWYLADLVHHMLSDHEPAPALFDAFVAALAGMEGPEGPGPSLLRFQWQLLTEGGYRPQLDADAETRAPLPDSDPTLAFSPAAGGVVADTGAADRWRVRAETIALLRTLDAAPPVLQADAASIERANRLLAAYLREILGVELPTVRLRFPSLSRFDQSGPSQP
jgi:DNA repair protein RecO (recombination protein O)